MRGLMIVNPNATSTNGAIPELVTRSLAGLVDLEVQRTQHRGHARELAAAADVDLMIVLGGDGSVNEVVNGLMSREAPRPRLAVIPGGGANVLARGLGLPANATAAVRHVREIIESGQYRTIGLGLAGDRYFTFSAGLGLDAEVVGEVERQRTRGRRESASLFLRSMMRLYFSGTDRRQPALTLDRDSEPVAGQLFMCIVTNRSPWTYFRGRALLPVPDPDFNSGLDVLALQRIRLSTILAVVGQMLWVRKRPTRGRDLLSVHGLESLALRSARPIAFQVDGEYLGETEAVEFHFVPDALQVVA
ncbi:MAG: diacylglycerol kinase family protein [Streptosporangiaceae bacterium]